MDANGANQRETSPDLVIQARDETAHRRENTPGPDFEHSEYNATSFDQNRVHHRDGESRTTPSSFVWRPSIVLGSPLWLEGEDLSRIEIADRKIAQRRLWVEHYQGSPQFATLLQEAISERRQLDETDEENTLPKSSLASTKWESIEQRLEVLRSALGESTFGPERANIEAAITGYESGDILCSSDYTIIWAGRIVDRCEDYSALIKDRRERLDQYQRDYGDGWLWYEPPLQGDADDAIRGPSTGIIKKGFCVDNLKMWRKKTDNMGHYQLTMSFQRVKAAVARTQQHSTSLTKDKGISGHSSPTAPGSVADVDGPTVYWNMLLDTGATLPCLFESDLQKLKIDPNNYAAQSVRRIATAESVSAMRTYELHAGLHAETPDGLQSLWTGRQPGKQTGDQDVGIVPVVMLRGKPSRNDWDPHSIPDRLTGLLPFHVVYLSSAPGNFKIWMGLNRRDVLGTGRLPASMRLTKWKDNAKEVQDRYGTPERVTFEHRLENGRSLCEVDSLDGTVFVHPDDTTSERSGEEHSAKKRKIH